MEKLNAVIEDLNSSINLYNGDLEHFKFEKDLLTSIKNSLDGQTQEMILDSLSAYNSIITQFPETRDCPIEVNRFQFQLFLDKFNLKVDDRFFTGLDEDHIIEIYAKNKQQIYRSANFFKFSSYDIETLTFIPWDQLYFRSEEEQIKLESRLLEVIENELDIIIPSNSSHTLEEVQTNKKFRHKLCKGGVVRDKDTSEVMGVISLIKVKEIPQGFHIVQ